MLGDKLVLCGIGAQGARKFGDPMDITQIILAVISGTIGGGLGGLVGSFFSSFLSFGSLSMRRFWAVIFPILGIAVGLNYLMPIIGPKIEEPISVLVEKTDPPSTSENEPSGRAASSLPQRPPEADIRAHVDEAMRAFNDPIIRAIIAREPDRQEGWRQRFEGAYIRGRDEALKEEADRIRIEIGTVSVPFYLARAQDEDLIGATVAMRDAILAINEVDPVVCHLWVYGAITGQSFDYDRYLVAIGEEQNEQLQTALAKAVRDAYDFLPEYDEALAVQSLAEMGQIIYQRLGDEKIGLIISAQIPESEEDSRLACDATAELYSLVLASDARATILRHMFTYGQLSY